MIELQIKPLSINECWRGRRFKTDAYQIYEHSVSKLLPDDFVIPKKPLKVYFEFGFSNSNADIDNPVKPIIDILQKKYNFNDRDIHIMELVKNNTEKGKEYVKIQILSL